MKGITIALIALASPVAAQTTTNCSTLGTFTNCRTTNDQPVPNVAADMLANMQLQQRQQQAEQARAAVVFGQQRAAAFAQVGGLIAKGDCEGAQRLADFYGWRDLRKNTAKACAGK